MQDGDGDPDSLEPLEQLETLEPQSLEYIEDPYFIRLESHATPSLDEDEDDESEAVTWSRLSPPDLHDDSLLCVETEFVSDQKPRRGRLLVFKRRVRDVRVTFQDLSKPYLVKISSHNNYKKFLGLAAGGSTNTKPAHITLDAEQWCFEMNIFAVVVL